MQRLKLWFTLTTRMPCSNAAKTRNPLKLLAGCLKLTNRCQPLVGRTSPYYGDMWRRYCCLTSLCPIVDACLICEDIARRSCAMVPRWRFLATFLRPVFAASRVQQVLDLHSKFALRPRHVYKRQRYCCLTSFFRLSMHALFAKI